MLHSKCAQGLLLVRTLHKLQNSARSLRYVTVRTRSNLIGEKNFCLTESKPSQNLDSSFSQPCIAEHSPLGCNTVYFGIRSHTFQRDRLCGLVVRVPGYRSRCPDSIPGATTFSEK
jgi:hypothetical protein